MRERETLEIHQRSGCYATADTEENIDFVHHVMIDDRRLVIYQITNAISISREKVEDIPHKNLGMTKVTSRWVTLDQKST